MYPGIFYLRGGDAISGRIHDELCETNSVDSVPAVMELCALECWGIEQLEKKFGKVHVISIGGNHGRMTVKPRHKRYLQTNLELLIAWGIEKHFVGNSNVTFDTPISGDAYFQIFGWNILMQHGDRMGSRGGAGFVGPAATIARGHKKLIRQYADKGLIVHCVLTGHLHCPLELEDGFANGSLAGYSEFAQTLRAKVGPPVQWLLFFHPENFITARWKIQLEKPMPVHTPENWVFA